LLKLSLADDAVVARRICQVKRRRAAAADRFAGRNLDLANSGEISKPPTRRPSPPSPPALGAGPRLIEPHAPRTPRVLLDQAALQAAAVAFAAGEIDRGELMRRINARIKTQSA
jgi:hypothetical protein